jgi:hypothetical protein
MNRREANLPVGSRPIADATPDGQDDDLVYDSGGIFYRFMGVASIGSVLVCAGLVLGFRIPTVAAVAVAFVALGGAWAYYQESIIYPRRRAEKMQEAAAALGPAYRADVPPAQLEQLKEIAPFSAGQKHRAYNLLAGTYQGTTVCVLDSYYLVGGGGKAAGYWQTVVLLPDASGVPDFELAPRRFLHRVAALLGSQDIRFSGDASREVFSRHYLLRGAREQAVRAAFDGPAVAYFADHPGWTVSCRGGTLAILRTELTKMEASAHFKLTPVVDPGFRYVVPADIPRLLARALAIRRVLPETRVA